MTISFRCLSGTVCAAILVAPIAGAQDANQANPVGPSFPRAMAGDAGTVVVHAPQIDAWQDFVTVEARSAIEVTPAGSDDVEYGIVEFQADTDPNLELRVVAVENLRFKSIDFPSLDESTVEELIAIVRATLQPRTQYVPLDVILTYIAPDATLRETPGLNYDPPTIFYSTTPALLLNVDGEPLLAPIDGTDLKYAVNTNWDLIRHKDRDWYLRHEQRWLKSRALDGEWKYDNSLPRDFSKLPDDGNWTDAKAAIPPEKGGKDAPTVFASLRPAELIAIDGAPVYASIGEPGLEYATNTDSDLFRYDHRFYYLVSGRWFRADRLRGPWQFVSELPAPFAAIPEDHPKAHVLAAVAGTDEARLAALEASMPRKATIARSQGQNVTVLYEGDPEFQPIEGTSIQRAVNSAHEVLLIGNLYYLCANAVWYVAEAPKGPWSVADAVPIDIYSIPPTSPAYHVTHVHVYESDDDSVTTGYTSGYIGVSVGFGVAMYGSGWYYPSYYGYHPYYGYPYYYPYPYSYGASAWYNPKTGAFGRASSVYGPYGGYGRGGSYNPETGTIARGAAVWDSNEIAFSGAAYNPRTGTGIRTDRYSNGYSGWGESLITHNDRWLETQSEWTGNTRTTRLEGSEGGTGTIERRDIGRGSVGSGEFQRDDQSLTTRSASGDRGTVVGGATGDGQRGAIGRSADGDLYAGKDGKIYKRDGDGWQELDGDQWSRVELPPDRAGSVADRRDDLARSRPESPARERLEARPVEPRSRPRSLDPARSRELDRSYNARRNGYDRFNSRRGSSGGGGRAIRGRRR